MDYGDVGRSLSHGIDAESETDQLMLTDASQQIQDLLEKQIKHPSD